MLVPPRLLHPRIKADQLVERIRFLQHQCIKINLILELHSTEILHIILKISQPDIDSYTNLMEPMELRFQFQQLQ